MKLMRTPKSLDLEITNKCNLRCLYCYHFSSAGEVEADLPTEEWLRFFEELNRCAVMDVTLCGGEPFLRKDFRQLLEALVANRQRFSILTNGTLITDKMAEYIASTRRCNTVQVSIDGSTPEVHDSCRGEGNFVKAVEGAKRLIDHGVSTTVRVTIHKSNVRDLDNVARLLLEELKLPGFSTNSASHMGLCRKNAEMVQLSTEDRMLAMESLVRLTKKYPGRISAQAGPQAEADHWSRMDRAFRAGEPAQPSCGFLNSCNGPTRKLSVRADGVIVPCAQIGHIELGRINRDSLAEIWQHHPELQRLRARHQIPLARFEFCQGCGYIPYCKGGCPATAYTHVGTDEHPSPDSCLRQFLKNGGRLPHPELAPVLRHQE